MIKQKPKYAHYKSDDRFKSIKMLFTEIAEVGRIA